MLAPPWISVPPPGYGGVESVVSVLTEALVGRGNEVVFSIAQKIAVLHQGRLIADGAPAEVRADPTVRRVYLGEH